MENRVIYLDILRIISIIAVIFIHVSMESWMNFSMNSSSWQISNVFNSISRFAVPVLIMVSGVLFLNPRKAIDFKSIFNKYIFRIATAFIFWSALYALFNGILLYKDINISMLKFSAKRFIIGEYHMWFLYTIVGMYIITPFLKKIVENRKLTEHFIILSFIFGILIPTLQEFPILNKTVFISDKLNLFFFFGYSFYFVLGYYLFSYHLSKPIKNILYILGILSFIVTLLSTNLLVHYNKIKYLSTDYGYEINLMPHIALISVVIFLTFKDKLNLEKSTKHNFIFKLSTLSFGAYLIHVLFIKILSLLGLSSGLFNPLFSIPLISSIVILLSFFSSYLLSKVPYVNKYIL
ncbi:MULTISPECIES: acyltransferase [Metabacillus]|uniref:Acyltransferase 3 domain-containing protein n=2 Tax=Metabacillus TaxID=2675233 RepID=A0A179T487_9BACI|nr:MULTISPECIES: acyltransferase family protein [Metabacillus]OAS88190.1 hypothetical protein A6K24_17600 [Metabacillus litoralis]QNF27379.1 acyltransferase family protein [Metabacillus sp. KUDC1714]